MSSSNSKEIAVKAIGYIETPFDEKFAVPRQSSLISHGHFEIHFYPPYDREEAFAGIDGFSHLWISFLFDRNSDDEEFRPMVRPPRLGGNEYKGVFATRSPFRPNRLGLSVVRLKKVNNVSGHVSLIVEGADMVNGTPIVDIKPYICFVDSVPDAVSGFAPEAPKMQEVRFTDLALRQIEETGIAEFGNLIQEVLAQDPRPAYRAAHSDDRIYGVGLCGHDVKWCVKDGTFIVLRLEKKND